MGTKPSDVMTLTELKALSRRRVALAKRAVKQTKDTAQHKAAERDLATARKLLAWSEKRDGA